MQNSTVRTAKKTKHSQCFPGIGNEGEAGCGAGEHRCKAYGGGSGTITYMVCVNSSSSESECDPESTEEGEEEDVSDPNWPEEAWGLIVAQAEKIACPA